MRARTRVKKRPFPAGWLLLGLLACGILFWWGAQAAPSTLGNASDPVSVIAVLSAFAAVCVGPVLLIVTVLWGSFAFFRWLWVGGLE
jgi:hypothetical protein